MNDRCTAKYLDLAGYTVVELVVFMALVVTVSVLGLPALQSATGNAQTRAVAESVLHGLQQARVEAIKRNTAIQFVLNSDSSWQLGCVVVSASCPALLSSKTAKEGSAVPLSIQANALSVRFSSFGSLDPALTPALAQVEVSNPAVPVAERKSLRVLLAAGGDSRMCEPAVQTTGDPRAC